MNFEKWVALRIFVRPLNEQISFFKYLNSSNVQWMGIAKIFQRFLNVQVHFLT